jgi:hypothetical protein
MLETKTVQIRGQEFVIAELSIDDIEAWEKGMRSLAPGASLSDLYAIQRKACGAALKAGGHNDAADIGTLSPRGLGELVSAVMSFSNMVVTVPGEAKGSP